jgi:Zn-dependent protease
LADLRARAKLGATVTLQPNTGFPVPQPPRPEPRFEERAPGSPVPATAPPKRRGLGALGAVLLTLLAKGKGLLLLLKGLPLAKLLLTSASMFAMIAFEARRSGIWFAVGFVLTILVHELGHGYAMKRNGVQAGWPVFIPFFGAMIAMKGEPQDREIEARIAYGGPLAGTAASLVAAALGLAVESRVLLAIAYTGFFLNLFNLTPFSPLDGGRVAQAFSRRAWIFGAVVMGGMFLVTRAPQLALIALLSLPRLFGRNTDTRAALARPQQIGWAARYFGLAVFLAAGMYFTSSLLHPATRDDGDGDGVMAGARPPARPSSSHRTGV